MSRPMELHCTLYCMVLYCIYTFILQSRWWINSNTKRVVWNLLCPYTPSPRNVQTHIWVIVHIYAHICGGCPENYLFAYNRIVKHKWQWIVLLITENNGGVGEELWCPNAPWSIHQNPWSVQGLTLCSAQCRLCRALWTSLPGWTY